MKQKITIEAQIRCDKCRSKAMKIAAVEDGVISVAFKGAKRDQIEIIGDEVDAAGLAKLLRKKLGYADLVSVEEITEKKVNQKENGGDCHHHPHEMELHIYDDPPSRGCTIM
ncbi:hypothetical protein M0R45_015460 [Rubus argutus]|uniref:HMA domain-containing protein n=1 Tax=Rubus argutus TaxID=59490 RepID=A0AAW1XPS2_RUBAR